MHPASIHDPIGDELAAAVTKARDRRDAFVRQWNQRGQLLFDPDQHSQQLILEEGFDNSLENFNRRHEELRQELIRAQQALNAHVMRQVEAAAKEAQPTQLSIV